MNVSDTRELQFDPRSQKPEGVRRRAGRMADGKPNVVADAGLTRRRSRLAQREAAREQRRGSCTSLRRRLERTRSGAAERDGAGALGARWSAPYGWTGCAGPWSA